MGIKYVVPEPSLAGRWILVCDLKCHNTPIVAFDSHGKWTFALHTINYALKNGWIMGSKGGFYCLFCLKSNPKIADIILKN